MTDISGAYEDFSALEVSGKSVPTYLERLASRIEIIVQKVGMDKCVQATGKSAKTIRRYVDGGEPPAGVIVGLAAAAEATIGWVAGGQPQTSNDIDLEIRFLTEETDALREIEPKSLDQQQLLGLHLMQIEALERMLTVQLSIERRGGIQQTLPSDSRSGTSHVPVRTEQEHGELPMQMVDPRSLEEGAFVVLPLMDISAAAGSGRLSPDFPAVRSQVALSEDYLRSIGVPPRFAQLLEIDGDSMFPTLKDRDVAVVDTSIVEVRSDAIYAVVYGGLVVAKRVQINRDGSILLSSDNKGAGYRDERVASGDLHELQIAGRIKGRVGSV